MQSLPGILDGLWVCCPVGTWFAAGDLTELRRRGGARRRRADLHGTVGLAS